MRVKPDVPFTCNICGAGGVFGGAHYENAEMSSCGACGSNVRFRWLVHRLSVELFGRSLGLKQFPSDKSIRGIGLTDPRCIADVLEHRLTYLNTFLDRDPRLDIRCDPSPLGPLDFVIASEVFEHVEPPVMRAFPNVASLLKPSGFLLLTVPWVWDGSTSEAIPELYDWTLSRDEEGWVVLNRRPDGAEERFRNMAFDGSPGSCLGATREHFPDLCDWKLIQIDDRFRLVNRRADGQLETFDHLVFHSGPGLGLEMRLFTKNDLHRSLTKAGFHRVDFEMENFLPAGIIFPDPWSRHVVASF